MVCWLRSLFQGSEGVGLAQPGEPVGESVVVEVDGQDGFAKQGGEDALVSGDPGLESSGVSTGFLLRPAQATFGRDRLRIV